MGVLFDPFDRKVIFKVFEVAWNQNIASYGFNPKGSPTTSKYDLKERKVKFKAFALESDDESFTTVIWILSRDRLQQATIPHFRVASISSSSDLSVCSQLCS